MRALFLLMAAGEEEEPPLEAPGVPQSPSTSTVSSTQIDLSWTAPATGGEVANYRAQRALNEAFTMGVATLTPTLTIANFTGLDPETTYWFRVRAENAAGQSAYTTPISAATPAPGAPNAPSNLVAAELTSSSIRLTWTDNSSDEDGFRIYRSVDGGAFSAVDTTAANATTYDDTGLTPKGEYEYYVVAFAGSTESAQSNKDSVLNLGAPGDPTGLTTDPISDSRIDLSWTNGGGSPDAQYIFRDGVQIDSVGGAATSYSATGLSEVTSYDWEVQAGIDTARSAKSNLVTQVTRLKTPTSFDALQLSGFVRFTWVDESSLNDEYVLTKDGTDFRTVSGTSTQVDVDDSEVGATGSWRVEARHATHLASAPTPAELGPPFPE